MPQRPLGLLRAGLIAGLCATSLVAAPLASARSLQAIYTDMVALDAQQPCQIAVAANLDCKLSVIQKVKLTNEVQPLLLAMPAPPRSPTDVAIGNTRYLAEYANKWNTAHCNSSPSFVDKITTCDGSTIQNYFSGLTTNVGQILHST